MKVTIYKDASYPDYGYSTTIGRFNKTIELSADEKALIDAAKEAYDKAQVVLKKLYNEQT